MMDLTSMKKLFLFNRDSRGATAVEFAIVSNLFVVMLIGIFAVGYAFVVKSDFEESINAAARYALIYDEDDSELSELMKSNLATYDGSAITLSFSRASVSGVEYVKADISYNIDLGVGSIFGPVSISTSRIFPT